MLVDAVRTAERTTDKPIHEGARGCLAACHSKLIITIIKSIPAHPKVNDSSVIPGDSITLDLASPRPSQVAAPCIQGSLRHPSSSDLRPSVSNISHAVQNSTHPACNH
ncbi:MAG: hypothetical protein LDL31_02900 [Prosthecobacter sp.]|nr:hypothetical protein [Prosthecobacter sp.]